MGKLKDCCVVHQLKYLVKEWVWPESCAGSCIMLTQLQTDTWATGTESQCSEMPPHHSFLWHKAWSWGHHRCLSIMRLIFLSAYIFTQICWYISLCYINKDQGLSWALNSPTIHVASQLALSLALVLGLLWVALSKAPGIYKASSEQRVPRHLALCHRIHH